MFFGFLLAGIVSWFLLAPLLVSGKRSGDLAVDSEFQTLREQKERCLQVLKDLELDHSTSKISPDDYERTRKSLQSELAGILKKIDRL